MKPAKDQTNDQLVLNLTNVCEAIGETRTTRSASQVLGDLRAELRSECKARLDKVSALETTVAEWEAEQALLIARNEQLKAVIADNDDAYARLRNRENELRIMLTKICNGNLTSTVLQVEFDKYQSQHSTGPYANG